MSRLKNIAWSPANYHEVSVLAREASKEMLSRLDLMMLKPDFILDAGCGVGEMSAALRLRYPEAQVMAVDSSQAMIDYAVQYSKPDPALTFVCADSSVLPLPNQSVDLVIANLLLPWLADIPALLNEWRRVLRPHGLLMLTALGPDTLKEWRESGQCEEIIPAFVDMHDLGDALLQQGFTEPVVDVDYYTLVYREQAKLLRELTTSGMISCAAQTVAEPEQSFTKDVNWHLTYEVIHAHAFMREDTYASVTATDGTIRVPLAQLREKLKHTS